MKQNKRKPTPLTEVFKLRLSPELSQMQKQLASDYNTDPSDLMRRLIVYVYENRPILNLPLESKSG